MHYMEILNIPELHIMVGIGQKLYDSTLETMSTEELDIHKGLLKKYGIYTSNYFGNAFEGNAMNKLLNSIKYLGFNHKKSCVSALEQFSQVVKSCLG